MSSQEQPETGEPQPLDMDGVLDLHMFPPREVKELVPVWLEECAAQGLTEVRIIHGKGRGSQGQQPVLKQKTDQWLQQMDAVLAYSSAPRWDGGTGATYVLLSRKFRDEF